MILLTNLFGRRPLAILLLLLCDLFISLVWSLYFISDADCNLFCAAGDACVADPAGAAGRGHIRAAVPGSRGGSGSQPVQEVSVLRVHREQRLHPLLPAQCVGRPDALPPLGVQPASCQYNETGNQGALLVFPVSSFSAALLALPCLECSRLIATMFLCKSVCWMYHA